MPKPAVPLAILALLAAAPAAAQAPDAVGIPACDEFLAAYAACAASPGVPEQARPGIIMGIAQMRAAWRDAAARDARSHRTIAAQCAQTHGSVSASMAQAFKCDFPGPSAASQALAPPVPPRREGAAARQAPALSADEVKGRAYVEAQNHLAQWHPLAKDLADHRRANERVLRQGARLGADAWYSFGVSDFDQAIEKLKAALALPGRVPEADEPAARLLAALEALNPTVKRLARYQTTREFQSDGFRLAREQEPVLARRMEAAIAAAESFADGLFDRETARDEALLARLQAGGEAVLARPVLAASIAARRTLRRLEAIETRAGAAAFSQAATELGAAANQLSEAAQRLAPPAPSCTAYARRIDGVLGHARDVARDLGGGGDPRQPAQLLVDDYNRSIEDLARCRRDEPRARAS